MSQRNRHKPRNPDMAIRVPTFYAEEDHVVALMAFGYVEKLGKNMTVGIRFISPKHMLEFFNKLMEQAVKVWPDDPYIQDYIQEYLSDEDEKHEDISKT